MILCICINYDYLGNNIQVTIYIESEDFYGVHSYIIGSFLIGIENCHIKKM
ncbi:hypothetical protein UT300018_26240 [Clostridium faecium]